MVQKTEGTLDEPQKHFLCTIVGPDSSYSPLEIHICWKVLSEERMEPPIHTEYLRSGGATTLIFIVEGARAVNSLVMRSPTLALFLSRRVLVLLVLGHKVIHIRLRLGELHLIHALARVPVQERLAAEHAGELFRNTLEHLLDRRRVADEAHGHLQSLRGDVTDAALHVVRDPLDEVRGVLVLHVEHLLVNLLRRHAATEETR